MRLPEGNHLRETFNSWLLVMLLLTTYGCAPTPGIADPAQQAVAVATVHAKSIATVQAAETRQLESTFVEKGPFTNEQFNKIKPNIFSLQHKLSPGDVINSLRSGSIIDVGLPDYIFILTSTHGELKYLPPVIYLYSSGKFNEKESIRLLPTDYEVNNDLDQTLFVAPRNTGRFTDKIGPGLRYQDHVNLDKIALGIFGYPQNYQYRAGNSLMFAQVYQGATEVRPQQYRINQEESTVAPISVGTSGGPAVAIINGEPTIVGVSWARLDTIHTDSQLTENENDVSSLNIEPMIDKLIKRIKLKH